MSASNVPFEPTKHPHRRSGGKHLLITLDNPLTGKHVLISPHRTKRPWMGQTETPVIAQLPKHDQGCYLCPGNKRMGGQENPDYENTFVFNNDFPALLTDPLPSLPSDPAATSQGISEMFASEPVRGRCKVICFHPRHDLTLAMMEPEEIEAVVEGWKGVYEEEGRFLSETGSREEGYVQIFENRGAMMGASAPHPHGQVWTLSYSALNTHTYSTPEEPATEIDNLEAYTKSTPSTGSHPTYPDGKSCLLLSYAAEEIQRKDRVVELDESGWVAVVPFWAVWPFEILLLPYKRHIPSILQLTQEEQAGLGRILKKILVRYDNLFKCPFPYSMGLHQAPTPPAQPDQSRAQIHFHFYPPLLRNASIRKFLVGFEMMAESQRDLTAEQAAARLRGVSDVHYTLTESKTGEANL